MENLIPISMLNDFVFCPYSIYLHNSYMDVEDDLFHTPFQQKGKNAHQSIDNHTYNTAKGDITSLAVFSEKWGFYGKIDLYKTKDKTLIERKRKISTIYDGYKYQLWAQYFCMIEMGFEIENLFFYSMVDNKMITLGLPTEEETLAFKLFIEKVKKYNPNNPIIINENKCRMCIYIDLCDKTSFRV